ncbi:Phosphatidylethanolamine-binding protein PEBP [Penicillium roqueforti FM164]|uniref:Phosphatidylethanolamine-binding protein PEBP n=1 Tax=Penicillium roqueforti (strain FM164) TaxID=1365484 RepID=W6PXE1_PENRF|nr:Phosphatidylethanolamine-binding protein PEBP [Penicillium roqueforti FM164]
MVTIVSAQIPESDTVLQVQYGSVTFKTGEKLRLSDITSAPSIGLSAPALTGTYIVIMIDPDAPDPTLPIFTQVLHWVQQDLIFSPMAGKYNTFVPLITPSPAPAAAPYLPPMPPPLLAPHRYIQTLFRQPAEFSINDLDLYLADSILRFGFNLSRFAQENMLGEPIASNFFLAGDETIQIR